MIGKINNKPKCPKCSSIKIDIIEVMSVSSTYSWWDYMEIPSHMPDYMYTNGECQDCKHYWRFRKIIDINKLVETASKSN